MTKITSRDNSLLRRVRAVRDGKISESIYIEGLRLCEEALRSRLTIDAVIYSEQIAAKQSAADLIQQLERAAEQSASVSEKLLASISYTKTPQGIIVLAARPTISEKQFKARQSGSALIVVLHKINNPVNIGAVLRTAEAAGVTGAITTLGTCDPFSPKALRGAMGSAFRLPIWSEVDYERTIEWLRKQGIHTVCADANATKAFTETDWRASVALIVGPESLGLSESEIAAADESIRIPMETPVESLNVSVAAAIILYEARRQRAKS